MRRFPTALVAMLLLGALGCAGRAPDRRGTPATQPVAAGPLAEVRVRDHRGRPLPAATVSLERPGQQTIRLQYSAQHQAHRGGGVLPGYYFLRATRVGFADEERAVKADVTGLREVVVFGPPGRPSFYRGKTKVYFEPRPALIGVSVVYGMTPGDEARLSAFTSALGLQPVATGDPVRLDLVRVFRSSGPVAPPVLARLSAHPLVRRAGPLLHLSPDGASFLTDELVVRFLPHVTNDRSTALAERFDLDKVGALPSLGNVFLLRSREGPSYDLLEAAEGLLRTGLVEYAEPNLVVTKEDLQGTTVQPQDFIYQLGDQPALGLVELPQAWHVMGSVSSDLTFGDDDVVIAVLDRGIQSTHPELNVRVAPSNSAKITQLLNFVNWSPDNNGNLDHGMWVAGLATAVANNLSFAAEMPAAEEVEATAVPATPEYEGIAGVAPNTRVMGLIRPAGGTDTDYAAAYYWIAGFESLVQGLGYLSPDAARPPADVIVNSFHEDAICENQEIPLPSLLAEAFDKLTAEGRDGKGIVLLFGAGRPPGAGSGPYYMNNYRWAEYGKTLAVAASMLNDQWATDSNEGDYLDVCAPSGNGIVTCNNRLFGNRIGHTGGTKDYFEPFGGTSSATPQAAGLAALILSLDADLTWEEVRRVLRETADDEDDGVGQAAEWSGDYSQRYGYGRINAFAAVAAAKVAAETGALADVWIKEHENDDGSVPSPPPFSPDLWVRNSADGATEHQSPIRGQSNWVYTNVRNRGAVEAHNVTAKVFITRWAGTQYVYPDDFTPLAPPGGPDLMEPGTYSIGEQPIATIPPQGTVTVVSEWPPQLIPPASVTINNVTYSWADSCLLVDLTPHDGPPAAGAHTWDHNNLAQRNLTIVDAAAQDTVALLFFVGHRRNPDKRLDLRIERNRLPPSMPLYVDYVSPNATRDAYRFLQAGPPPRYALSPTIVFGRRMFELPAVNRTYAPIQRAAGEYQPVALVVDGLKQLPPGDYRIDVFQESPRGRLDGGLSLVIRRP